MNFLKRHKIATVTLLTVLILSAGLIWFVKDKLDRITYDDGKVTETEVTKPDDGEVGESVPGTEQEPAGETKETETEFVNESADDGLSEGQMAGLEDTEIVLSEMDIFADKDVFNILLLGTDERSDSYSAFSRADSIILVSVHKEEKTIKLVSLERDMGVPILEGKHTGTYDKLTHCFAYGGADLMMKEVEHCFRVDVDRFVRLNFSHFAQIIDAIGGVDIELTELEAQGLNGEIRTNAWTKHKVYPGLNHLDGYDALQYARLRYIDSDWQRVQRQRNVIQSIVYAATELSLLEMNEAADKILPLIHTNLTQKEMLELLFFAPNVFGAKLEQMTLPKSGTYGVMTGLDDRTMFAVDFDVNAQILRDFLGGSNVE